MSTLVPPGTLRGWSRPFMAGAVGDDPLLSPISGSPAARGESLAPRGLPTCDTVDSGPAPSGCVAGGETGQRDRAEK
jgi:hypothetical protein